MSIRLCEFREENWLGSVVVEQEPNGHFQRSSLRISRSIAECINRSVCRADQIVLLRILSLEDSIDAFYLRGFSLLFLEPLVPLGRDRSVSSDKLPI